MPRFLIDQSNLQPGDSITLSPEESHHALRVYRVKIGDLLSLIDGQGTQYQAKITSLYPKRVALSIQEKVLQKKKSGSLKIAPAVLKKNKMELVIQKAAELGVDSLHPFYSSRNIVKPKRDKQDRWQKIADQALKQSGRSDKMIVHSPVSFEKILAAVSADLKLIFWEEAKGDVKKTLSRITHQTTLALIGPEGGFSKEEANHAKQDGYQTLSLGSRILRAETAAITVMSLIQYELGNLSR